MTVSLLTQLSAGRIGAGVLAWAAPSLTGKLLGIGGPAESHLAARLFGARDIALGAATLSADGETRRMLLQMGLLCDALDAAAAGVGVRRQTVRKNQAVVAGGAAMAAVVIGLLALVNDSQGSAG